MANTPLQGAVPGMTWAQFQQALGGYQTQLTNAMAGAQNFNGEGGGSFNSMPIVGESVPGIGDLNVEQYGVNPNGAGTASYNYRQQLADGTSNYFSEGPNGELLSQNNTDQNDSWLQRAMDTIAPYVSFAPFAAAGIGALAGAGGAGSAGAAAGAGALDASGLAAGEFGLEGAAGGAFTGGDFAAGAGGLLGSDGSLALGEGGNFSPGSFGTGLPGSVADGTAAGTEAANPSFLDSLQNLASQYHIGGTPWDAVSNIAGGTGQAGDYLGLASNANTAAGLASDFGGGDGSFSTSTSPTASSLPTGTNTDPMFGTNTQVGALTDQAAQNANANQLGIGGSGNALSGLLGGGSSPLSSLGNIIDGNGGTSDYLSLLGGAGSILSGVLGSKAATSAANQQTSAINNANALTAAIYGDTVNRNQPFVNAGTGATNTLSNLYGLNGQAAQNTAYNNFQYSPNYQTAYSQGEKGIGNAAAASGLVGSGRYLKDAGKFASGLGTQQYGAYTSGLSGLAQLGQASANNTAAAGAGYSNQASNLLTAGGIAQSAGTIGSNNAITNALSQLLKNASNGIYGSGG